MGNERRLVVLCHLCEREHSVNELCRLVGLSQSALSQHLAKLRSAHLVQTRRSAQTVYYSIASPEVAPLLRCLSQAFGPGGNHPVAHGDLAPERPCAPESPAEQAVSPKTGI